MQLLKDDLMCRKPWLVTAICLTTLCMAGDLQAQGPGGAGQSPFYYAGYPGNGPSYMPQIAGAPAEMAAWPGISPYDHSFVQTYNQDGLWIQDVNDSPRQYYLTLDALVSHVRRPNRTLIGSPHVPNSGNITTFGEATMGAVDDEFVTSNLIDPHSVNQQKAITTSPGMKARWGFREPDGTGVELDGWWQSEGHWLFQRGYGGVPGTASQSRVTAAVPLYTGSLSTSDYVPYDQKFRIFMDSESMGAGIKFVLSKKVSGNAWHVQPIWGLRYIFLRERFSFHGIDSGLTIEYDQNGLPDLTTVEPRVAPYQGGLDSSTRSHLAGPEIGLAYQMGGRKLMLSGTSTFGLMANHERMRLDGFGIGSPDLGTFDQNATFTDRYETTHVSPILEQTFNAEFKMIHLIPLLRRIELLEQAKFRVGYSVLAMWQVARPNDTIRWQGQPLNPFIRPDHTKWYIHGWHFGFDWRY